jgi:hypothetical protein
MSQKKIFDYYKDLNISLNDSDNKYQLSIIAQNTLQELQLKQDILECRNNIETDWIVMDYVYGNFIYRPGYPTDYTNFYLYGISTQFINYNVYINNIPNILISKLKANILIRAGINDTTQTTEFDKLTIYQFNAINVISETDDNSDIIFITSLFLHSDLMAPQSVNYHSFPEGYGPQTQTFYSRLVFSI